MRSDDEQRRDGVGDAHRREERVVRSLAHLRGLVGGQLVGDLLGGADGLAGRGGGLGGEPRARRATTLWKCEANTLPSTATPSAPPVWRVVSLTADPTPARLGGSEPMIDSVAGAWVSPRPMPRTSRMTKPMANVDISVSDA